MKKVLYAVTTAALWLACGLAVSHSGGLDKYGCHTDHKRGDYHCHR